MFKAGLLHENPNISDDIVCTIIDEIGLKKAAEAIGEAFQYALGGGETKN
jgi:hypothetical protein